MTAVVWLLELGGQSWLWVQDGLNPQDDRAFLAAHDDAIDVTDAFGAALVRYLTNDAAGLIS